MVVTAIVMLNLLIMCGADSSTNKYPDISILPSIQQTQTMANKLFFNSFILSLFFLTSQANTLAKIEVDALVQIGKKMGKSNWDFKVDPCSGLGNWSIPNPIKGFESFVNCSCSLAVNNSTCHITSLSLKGENLSGTLPPEIAKLKYLQQLDLSRNYLNGTVPKEWSTLKLLGLSLMANRLSGKFPDTLTQITTLVNMSIEGNRFSGPLPSSIGKLVNLESLTISANQFTGNLPLSMKMLTHLTDLRLSSNNFSGKIPDFIQSLTRLNKLHIQGCSFKGPIPSAISHLKNLTDLRITDLIGNTSTMPDLSGMKNMKTLMLRNCSIHGNIPPYIGNMKTLKYLDLSFNEMGGDIPETFSSLMKVDKIYLTDNMLTGTISSSFLRRTKDTDISYNNFKMDKSSPNQCSHGTINMAECYSTSPDITTVPSCLKKNFPCTETGDYRSSLHINCGGESISLNGTKYEQDNEQVLAASLYSPNSGWAFSSTGNFMDDDLEADNYIASNSSALSMPNSQLYTRARLSPITLTYYARCMINGSYTVNLHFAEIVFTNDRTFLSLGERVFNVYIQEKLVLEDFNIAKEAGGPGKAIIKTFNVSISNHVMKIRFYWAGKGTTGIPNRGTYGPLINAISITPNFEVPTPETHSRKKTVILFWTLILSSILILLGFGFLWWKRSRRIGYVYKDLDGFDLKTGSFTLRQVKAATRNFDATNKIGEGGFGSVYKGLLKDGTIIAVKQLSSKSKQGSREFVNEIGMISSLHHPNLVKLYGCCTEGNQLLLIYEYMENNCLARALFGKNPEFKLKLDWPTRRNICIGIARGLAYLHEESRLKIVHRDIKASNVLLDKELNAKISDFGLAKLHEDDHTHISTRIAGTIGYMAPEYAMRGHLTVKADIYSFGVVALEIVSGKSNTNYRPKEDFVYLLDWACVLQEKGNLLELVDPELGSAYSEEEALLMLNIALLCTHASPTLRPAMSKVVSIIEGSTPLQPLLNHMNLSANSLSSAGIRRNFWENPGQSLSLSHDVSFTDSSGYTSNRGNDSILEKDISDSVSLMQ